MNGRSSPPPEKRSERPALPADPKPIGDGGRAPSRRRTRILAGVFSAGAHLVVIAALLWLRTGPPPPSVEPAPMLVSLVDSPKPEPPGPPDVATVKIGPQNVIRPVLPRLVAPVLAADPTPASEAPVPDNSDILSEFQIAGATGADNEGGGGGGGGGGCNTARIVQQALQRDPLVRTAVEDAHRVGKTIMLWNGDWVRSGGQDGKGLSAVREAIVWELAFTSEACRNKQVHGLVLLSLVDGNTRFAIGADDWRWSDLLGLRGASSGR